MRLVSPQSWAYIWMSDLGALIPKTEDDVYIFNLFTTTIYLFVAYGIQWAKKRDFGRPDTILTRVFDGVTFSSSLLILAAIVSPDVLKALGNTKLYLIVAGLGGIIYSMYALKPRT